MGGIEKVEPKSGAASGDPQCLKGLSSHSIGPTRKNESRSKPLEVHYCTHQGPNRTQMAIPVTSLPQNSQN